MTTYLFEICLRCHRPITTDSQTCKTQWGRWRCVPRSDKTLIEVNGMFLKTGDDATPVPILEDYYG